MDYDSNREGNDTLPIIPVTMEQYFFPTDDKEKVRRLKIALAYAVASKQTNDGGTRCRSIKFIINTHGGSGTYAKREKTARSSTFLVPENCAIMYAVKEGETLTMSKQAKIDLRFVCQEYMIPSEFVYEGDRAENCYVEGDDLLEPDMLLQEETAYGIYVCLATPEPDESCDGRFYEDTLVQVYDYGAHYESCLEKEVQIIRSFCEDAHSGLLGGSFDGYIDIYFLGCRFDGPEAEEDAPIVSLDSRFHWNPQFGTQQGCHNEEVFPYCDPPSIDRRVAGGSGSIRNKNIHHKKTRKRRRDKRRFIHRKQTMRRRT